MKKKINKEKNKMIFEIRKSLIDKICKWEEQGFYAIMLFIGSIILSIIYNLDKVPYPLSIILGVFIIGYILLISTEYYSLKRMHSLHKKLIEDIDKENLSKVEKFSLKKYILNK